ncbi:MAG: SDR family NAD(P)-dependent oxidoreductase [Saprospiraceae bacterium]
MSTKKIAFITGASSGIGYATALALSDRGYDLIICGRRAERLAELQKQVEGKSCVHPLIFDVSDIDQVEKAIQQLPESWKKIEVLVNNAGNAHGAGPIQEGDLTDWSKMIGSNVTGLLNVSRMILPLMVERQSGHVVNISSVAGKYTYENGAVYCASKKSVEAISEGMRLDLTKHGIKVSNIAPGAVETEFSIVRFKGDVEKANKIYDGFDPLTAKDIADVISYCVTAPDHVTIADVTIYAKAQSAPTIIHRK